MPQPWFRFYSEALRDRKIEWVCRKTGHPKALVLGVWAIVLALANDSPERGALLLVEDQPLGLDDMMIETGLDWDTTAQLWSAFESMQMVAHIEGVWYVAKWGGRQFQSDDSTARVKRWREEQNGEDVTLQSNVTETLHDTVTETLQKRCGNAPEAEADTEADTEAEQASKDACGLPDKLKDCGISLKHATSLLNDPWVTPERVDACWSAVQGRAGVTKPTGLLVRMLQDHDEPAVPPPKVGSEADRYRYASGEYAECIQS